MKRNSDFQTIHSEGGLLPPDLLRRILDPKEKVPGTLPEDYGLPQGERINETITQSWNRLRRHWAEFREAAKSLPQGEPGTGLTNDKWSVPLLRELGFGMLPTSPGPEINGRTYAINRFFGPTAIHLVGCGLSLDRRAAGVRGAAAANPHGLVQEFLNRSEGHLWAIVSNGQRFRVLRDNQALSRQSYLEFDLESMFSGEVFSDFVLLWLMAHATRFAPREEGKPDTCWLEQWTKLANEQGARALESLRGGVEKALQVLGQGFVDHPRNTVLREALRSGQVSLSDFHGQLLRVVYRLIFLFVAEDRTLDGVSLLHPRDESEEGRQRRERYAAHYSTARLRDLASHIKGSRHGDLWQQFNLLVGALSSEERFAAAREQLAIPVLGSFLWSPASTNTLNAASLTGRDGTELANADFLEALRHLAFTRQDKMLRPVDYKNLGAEELGGVYESLLALTPQISGDGARFTFAEFAGNERKTSGSYYTPDCLVQCLLDSALDPVVDEAIKGKSGKDAENAVLKLKVCDPACGSGHFLVGAAHRLARHLARIRAHAIGESEPSPLLYQHALRDIIGHCLYGVDINPMAVEPCKVSLWLEAMEPGKPLSFLDHHIQCGNSLLGTTPALLERGILDEAFTGIEGDEKEYCKKYKKQNKDERQTGQMYLEQDMYLERLANLPSDMMDIGRIRDDTIEGVYQKQARYEEIVHSSGYLLGLLLADAWCAAFVWKKREDPDLPFPITEGTFRRVEHNPQWIPDWMKAEIQRLTAQYQFLHWHLVFPDVFRGPGSDETLHGETSGWSGGFDVVLGNPPWDQVQFDDCEFFAVSFPEIANAANMSKRKKLIEELAERHPDAYEKYRAANRSVAGIKHVAHASGRYPLASYGRLNLAPLFVELSREILAPMGRAGLIVPSGIAFADSYSKCNGWRLEGSLMLGSCLSRSGPPRMGPLGVARRRRPTPAAPRLCTARGGIGVEFGRLFLETDRNRKGAPMPYHHLTSFERGKIHALFSLGESRAAIGRMLGRTPSTIGRELTRNDLSRRGYEPERAQQRYREMRKACVKQKSLAYPPLRRYLFEKGSEAWSPEQVAGRLRVEFPHDSRMHVAPETIYRGLYSDEKFGHALIPYLRQGRKKRRKRGMGLHRRGPGLPNRVSIEQRPQEVELRKQCGHWEGDTLIGKNQRGAVATLVERKSLFLRAANLSSKNAQAVAQAIVHVLSNLPAHTVKTITFDNGTEFAAHERIAQALTADIYFAHPYTPNERARNENTNGLLRQYLPKGSSFENLSQRQLNTIVHELNNRPRKSLGYRTPYELFRKEAIALES